MGARDPVGSVDPLSAYWGVLAPAMLWSAAFMERLATSAFDAFRTALTMSPDEAARLRHALIVLPARPASAITIVGAVITALDMSYSGSPNYVGLTFPFMILTFLGQTVYVSILFQLLFRLIRQMGIVRETLATSVAIDVFRPGPLHAFATLTSRPSAVLVLLVTSSVLVVPIQADLVPSSSAGSLTWSSPRSSQRSPSSYRCPASTRPSWSRRSGSNMRRRAGSR